VLADYCLQFGEEDYNQDGKPELIRITVTAQSQHPVNSFKMLLQFSYNLQVSDVAHTILSDCSMLLMLTTYDSGMCSSPAFAFWPGSKPEYAKVCKELTAQKCA
jgi:hypothetical protein